MNTTSTLKTISTFRSLPCLGTASLCALTLSAMLLVPALRVQAIPPLPPLPTDTLSVQATDGATYSSTNTGFSVSAMSKRQRNGALDYPGGGSADIYQAAGVGEGLSAFLNSHSGATVQGVQWSWVHGPDGPYARPHFFMLSGVRMQSVSANYGEVETQVSFTEGSSKVGYY